MYKKNQGITLVALVVTIIVLVILAGVSIMMIFSENGIINMAQEAKKKTEQAQEDEKRSINELTKEMESIRDIQLPNKAIITFDNTDTTIIKSVHAIVTHKDNESGVNIEKCKWEYNTNQNPIGINEEDYKGGNFQTERQEIELSIQIPGKYYLHVLTIDKVGNAIETISEVVNVKYPFLTEIAKLGDYISYKGGNYTGKWQLLYNDDDNGIQMIASNSIGSIKLGGNSYNNGRDSYNNMVTTLNNSCQAYLNTEYGVSARNVGTDPKNKNYENTSIVITPWGVNTGCKEPLNVYQKDYDAMNNAKSQNDTGILRAGGNYWITSRYYVNQSLGYTFCIRYVDTNGNFQVLVPCDIGKDGVKGYYTATAAFRPVIILKNNLITTSGDGTITNPYILQNE